MAGTLFVVATPIGNLEDLSFRALRTLKEVQVIAAEDTRRTSKLLAHYGIRQSMVSLHEHNEIRETPRLIARLQAGESVALVSDAGTPGISDPGEHLVRAAREAGIRVNPIPGPSAVMAALSSSGVPASQFVFLGFPPRSGAARTTWLKDLAAEPRTAVFFEAPHRIARTVDDLLATLADRPIYIHRELTKIYEEFVERPSQAAAGSMEQTGEFVIVIRSRPIISPEPADTAAQLNTAVRMFGCLTKNGDFSDEQAVQLTATALLIDEATVRKAVKKARIAQKRRDEALS